jgi:hypothetical protein
VIEVSILIPVRGNDGTTFTAEEHAVFEERLVALFNGFTLLPGSAHGGWAEGGIVYRDETRIYAVFIGSLADGSKVSLAVAFAKTHYGQLAITIRYLGLSEIL